MLPNLLCHGASLGDVFLSDSGVALSHLDIRTTEDFCGLIQIAAVHHVPGREGLPQFVKAEVFDLCPF